MTTPSHETFREQLLDLAYGELGRREERALRRHLEGCAECRAELHEMTSTRSAMSALADEPAPERGEAILIAAGREAARERERKPVLPSWLWGASLSAVGLVVVAVISVRVVQQVTTPGLSTAPAELVAHEPAPAEPEAQPKADADARGRLAADAEPTEGVERDKAAAPAKEAAKKAFAEAPPAERKSPAPTFKRGRQVDELRQELAKRDGALGALGGRKGGETRLDDALQGEAGAGAVAEKKAARTKDLGEDRFAAAPPPPAEPPAPAAAPPSGAREHEDARLAKGEQPAAPAAAELAEERPDMKASADLATAAGPAASEAPAKPSVAPAKRRAAAQTSAGAVAQAPAGATAEDAISRHARLRVAGRLETVTRTFAGCPGESARVVEREATGAVVKLTRRGTFQGKPYQAELFYGEDGTLGAVRFSSEGRVRELRAGPPGTSTSAAGIPDAVTLPQRAADAGPDAPPRCSL